jgi:putative endonuclease
LITKFKRGNHAETIVASYLSRVGYLLIDRNVNTRLGEVDLIMSKDGDYFFIEVKSNYTPRFVNPFIKLTDVKVNRIFNTALIWANKHNINEERIFLKYCFVCFLNDYVKIWDLNNI